MAVNCCLVRQKPLFIGAMGNSHDVHVAKFGTTFTPITMGENLVAADFRSGSDLLAGRYRPMKKGVEARYAKAAGRRFDML